MKQSKTTLSLGVLLAIIVIVLAVFEIKNQTTTPEDAKIENQEVVSIGKKLGNKVVPVLKSVGEIIVANIADSN